MQPLRMTNDGATMSSEKRKYGLRGQVDSVRVEVSEFKDEDERRVERPWYGYTIRFNAEGNVIEQVHNNPDGSTWRIVKDYSEAGELIATKNYDASGQLSGEVRYIYEGGRLVAEQSVAPDGQNESPGHLRI
jgi:hypothetical protein